MAKSIKDQMKDAEIELTKSIGAGDWRKDSTGKTLIRYKDTEEERRNSLAMIFSQLQGDLRRLLPLNYKITTNKFITDFIAEVERFATKETIDLLSKIHVLEQSLPYGENDNVTRIMNKSLKLKLLLEPILKRYNPGRHSPRRTEHESLRFSFKIAYGHYDSFQKEAKIMEEVVPQIKQKLLNITPDMGVSKEIVQEMEQEIGRIEREHSQLKKHELKQKKAADIAVKAHNMRHKIPERLKAPYKHSCL